MQKHIFLIVLILLGASSVYAGTVYSRADGGWSVAGTWSSSGHAGPSCGCTPGSNDVVIVGGGNAITFSSDINLNGGGNPDQLTIESGASLTGDGSSDIQVSSGGILAVRGGFSVRTVDFSNGSIVNVEAGGLLTVTGSFGNSNNSDDVTVDGTMNVAGDFDAGNGSEITGSGDISVTGNVSLSGSASVFGCSLPTECCSGWLNCTFATALPIELVEFEADVHDNCVDIYWSTASEINNDYFTIEKSHHGKHFKELTTVWGAGNSTEQIDYFEKDCHPYNNISYYRLKQTDFDGTSTYSLIVAIEFHHKSNKDLYVYPNPSQGAFTIELKDFVEAEMVLVVVRDINGVEHYSNVVVASIDGNNVIAIDPSHELSPGTYTITGTTDDQLFSKTLIISK